MSSLACQRASGQRTSGASPCTSGANPCTSGAAQENCAQGHHKPCEPKRIRRTDGTNVRHHVPRSPFVYKTAANSALNKKRIAGLMAWISATTCLGRKKKQLSRSLYCTCTLGVLKETLQKRNGVGSLKSHLCPGPRVSKSTSAPRTFHVKGTRVSNGQIARKYTPLRYA